ncbi:hypothetical protein ID866_4943 [Astraeus odoratus]|nr:hypothetical protein ID866_4943 [Astraeus odoratus]
MKQRVEEMEREAKKLRELQAAAESTSSGGGGSDQGVPMETEEDRAMADSRSIFVGNVDYGATPEEIQGHFQACGTINRVTILCDKFTGHPKGYAYVEFAEPDFIDAALAMDNSLFRGRLIKVRGYSTPTISAFLDRNSRLQQSARISRASTGDAVEGLPGAVTGGGTEVGIVEMAMGTAPIVHVAGEGCDTCNVLKVAEHRRGRGRGF